MSNPRRCTGLPRCHRLPQRSGRTAEGLGSAHIGLHAERHTMRVRHLSMLLILLAPAVSAAQPEALAADEQTLAAAGLATDGQALLECFRARTRLEQDRERLLELTRQLGDVSAEVRARAAAELVARGAVAVPALRHAINDLSDQMIADRARQCLRSIEGNAGAAIPAA